MPKHVVVDGSNIATEGRAMPSLKQLNDAVMAYIEEHPDDLITVVVDATFGHRIDPREVPEFDAAVENNELVSPPAGAIGRGDAFVLTIANKAHAVVLSNDSFQEFHGEYPWLFDEGRLIGGKPVPHVGWVFVPRAPVRGPVSRKAVRDAGGRGRASVASRTHGRPSKLASEPMPVPKAPPPGRGRGRKAADKGPVEAAPAPAATAPSGVRHAAINELLPFLGFVERHPVGSTVEATVESYSSHGAYVSTDGVRAYVPLRYLGDPPPRSARDVLALGVQAEFVVVSFNPPRRGIDLAKPGYVPSVVVEGEPPPEVEAVPEPAAPAKKAARRAKKAAVEPEPAVEPGPPVKKAAKRAKKAAAEPEPVAAPEPAAPVKKGAKRVKKVAVEPTPPAEPEAPVKNAAKRAKKVAPAPDVAPEPAVPAKKVAKRAKKAVPAGADSAATAAAAS